MDGTAFDLRAIKNFDSRLEKLDKCRKICKLSMQEYESGYIYIYIYFSKFYSNRNTEFGTKRRNCKNRKILRTRIKLRTPSKT